LNISARIPILFAVAILLAASAAWLIGCGAKPKEGRAQPVEARTETQSARKPGFFVNVAEQAGLKFTHSNGATGLYRMVETTPGGCAFLDYDQDGWQDIFLIQSGPIPGTPPNTPRPPCALYRNNGDGTFTDVTRQTGIHKIDQGYAHAAAVGDYDNDGYPDLYITAYGGNHLLRNAAERRESGAKGGPAASRPESKIQNRKYVDVTAQARVGDTEDGARWATSAAWGDYDRDGYLDLIVLHYTRWTPETDRKCSNSNKQVTYCSPEVYPDDEFPRLYRNNRNGTFTDVTKPLGIHKAKGRGLGVMFIDYDQDGWPDIYIACDITPNMMLRNLKGKGFKDVALELGVSHGADASVLSGMGIAMGDYENRGWESIIVTNFSGQPNSVFKGIGKGLYEDFTYQSGIGEASLRFLAWGVEFVDYDNDGFLDVVVGNGHVDPFIADIAPNSTYKERKLLFRNQSNGLFKDQTEDLGDMWEERVTRGLAIGDYDNDGRMDVLDNSHNMPVHLYHNVGTGGRFAVFRLEGVKSNRDAVGALVWVTAGGRRRLAEVRDGSSYASTSDRRLHYGLGEATKVQKVEVRWPSGLKQTFTDLPANTFYYLREGAKPVPDPKVKR